jgi:GntR family transcriptional repressor for pyruvate dehydrogenase complex
LERDEGTVTLEDGPLPSIERSGIYTSVVDEILNSITSGGFAVGSPLPSERVLAGQLQVSRGSLREALRVLQHAGILESRPGSGTYVADGGSRAALLRAQAVSVGQHSPLDLIVARAAVEPVCAESAAVAHHGGDLAAIRAALDEQTTRTESGDDPTRADHDFHIAIAAASHNGVLLAIEHTFINLMQERLWLELKGRSRAHSSADYLEHHRLIYRAIEQRDARRAGQMMAMHISAIETGLIAELDSKAGPTTARARTSVAMEPGRRVSAQN